MPYKEKESCWVKHDAGGDQLTFLAYFQHYHFSLIILAVWMQLVWSGRGQFCASGRKDAVLGVPSPQNV
jgi:hypothetical protein